MSNTSNTDNIGNTSNMSNMGSLCNTRLLECFAPPETAMAT